jgi:hypothetical protein
MPRITSGVGIHPEPTRMEDMMRIRLMQLMRLGEPLLRRPHGAPSGAQSRLKLAGGVLAAALGAAVMTVPAAAVPINNLAPAAPPSVGRLQPVVWVCGPFRCWWRPGPYYWGPPYGYWPPAYGCNPNYNPYCYYRG